MSTNDFGLQSSPETPTPAEPLKPKRNRPENYMIETMRFTWKNYKAADIVRIQCAHPAFASRINVNKFQTRKWCIDDVSGRPPGRTFSKNLATALRALRFHIFVFVFPCLSRVCVCIQLREHANYMHKRRSIGRTIYDGRQYLYNNMLENQFHHKSFGFTRSLARSRTPIVLNTLAMENYNLHAACSHFYVSFSRHLCSTRVPGIRVSLTATK